MIWLAIRTAARSRNLDPQGRKFSGLLRNVLDAGTYRDRAGEGDASLAQPLGHGGAETIAHAQGGIDQELSFLLQAPQVDHAARPLTHVKDDGGPDARDGQVVLADHGNGVAGPLHRLAGEAHDGRVIAFVIGRKLDRTRDSGKRHQQ
jgi:hypothetical protein